MANYEKIIYFSFFENIIDLKLLPNVTSLEIKEKLWKKIVDIMQIKERSIQKDEKLNCNLQECLNNGDMNQILVRSPKRSRILSELDYNLSPNTRENPFFVEIKSPESNIHIDTLQFYNTQDQIVVSSSVHQDNKRASNHQKDTHDIETTIQSFVSTFNSSEVIIKSTLANLEAKCISLSQCIKELSNAHHVSQPSRNTLKSYSILQLPTLTIFQTKIHTLIPSCPDPMSIIPSNDSIYCILSQFKKIKFTEDEENCLSEKLKLVEFNNWDYSDFELIYLVRKMFIDMDFPHQFQISMHVLDKFLFEVYSQYNNVAFHNFKHAFMVTQMMFSLIHSGPLISKFSQLEHLILIASSICHDLNHPGFNNSFQINSQSPLAQLYNDQSPLENHHLAMCFAILRRNECDIFKSVTNEQQKSIRSGIVKCILATDMSKHNEILSGFKSLVSSGFDWSSSSHRDVLMMVLIKSSDISNEARPLDVATKWIDCLFYEFFQQSDYEKEHSLPVAPFMDKDKVTKAASQCGFIRYVIYPLFDSIAHLIPEMRDHIVVPVLHQLDYYSHLESVTSGRAKSRKSILTENISLQRRNSHQQPCLNQFRYKQPLPRHLETVISNNGDKEPHISTDTHHHGIGFRKMSS